ncbi:MAG: hypothetical protein OQJ80_02810 [Kangiella sp.]|nr:hypothetical protein [Kangiella sp.]
MLKKLSLLSLILLVSACATQSPVAEKNAPEDAEKVASEDSNRDIICKRTQKVGTHFKTKQCWTREDYEDLQEKSRQAVENAQGSSMTGPEGR